MEKPVLVIMAAGMGSRYGGLKQIDPVDEEGHIIMDFSIFDARRAGFEKVVFIIDVYKRQGIWQSTGIWLSWPVGWLIGTALSLGFYFSGVWKKSRLI